MRKNSRKKKKFQTDARNGAASETSMNETASREAGEAASPSAEAAPSVESPAENVTANATRAEENAKAEVEAARESEAAEEAKAEVEAEAKAVKEAKAKEEAEAKAAEEAKAEVEAEAKAAEEAKAEVEAEAKAAEEAKAKEEAEAKAAEEAKAKVEAESKAAEEAKTKEEAEVKAAEEAKAEAEAKAGETETVGRKAVVDENVLALMGEFHRDELENGSIVFEFPLMERVRNLLRIEYLLSRFKSLCSLNEPYVHHFALMTIFEIMDCASRAEFKLDLLQELERQRQKRLYVEYEDEQRILDNKSEIENIEKLLASLQSIQQKFAQNLRENEWLMALKQKMQVSGGVSPFDIPSFYLWQNFDFRSRLNDLTTWFDSLKPTGDAINYLLKFLRNNRIVTECRTRNGMYQQTGLGNQVAMLQIILPIEYKLMPEISANRHVMNIHFILPDFKHARGKGLADEIEFKIALCGFDTIHRDQDDNVVFGKPASPRRI